MIVSRNRPRRRMQTISYINTEEALRFLEFPELVDLNTATGISCEAAKLLSKRAGSLSLNGLLEISDDVAHALSAHCGPLALNGLSNLTEVSAKFLAIHDGLIWLESLIHITDPVLIALVTNCNGQRVIGIDQCESLSEVALEIASRADRRDLILDNLKTLNAQGASALAKFNGRKLSLNGLRSITNETAYSLSNWRSYVSMASWGECILGGSLHLGGLAQISPILGSIFSKLVSKIDLHLDGLIDLPIDVARSFSSFRGGLSMNGLVEISDEAITIVSYRPKKMVSLDGLTSLPDHHARCLATNNGPLYLNGLKNLSDSAARILSKHSEELCLNGITQLSDGAAFALSHHKGKLSLDGLEQLSEEATNYLGGFIRARQSGQIQVKYIQRVDVFKPDENISF